MLTTVSPPPYSLPLRSKAASSEKQEKLSASLSGTISRYDYDRAGERRKICWRYINNTSDMPKGRKKGESQRESSRFTSICHQCEQSHARFNSKPHNMGDENVLREKKNLNIHILKFSFSAFVREMEKSSKGFCVKVLMRALLPPRQMFSYFNFFPLSLSNLISWNNQMQIYSQIACDKMSIFCLVMEKWEACDLGLRLQSKMNCLKWF